MMSPPSPNESLPHPAIVLFFCMLFCCQVNGEIVVPALPVVCFPPLGIGETILRIMVFPLRY